MIKRKVNTTTKKPVVFGTSVEEKAVYKKVAAERHMSMSEFLRTAARESIAEKRNEPAIMLNLIELTYEIEKLVGIIPQEKAESMKKKIGNVMILKGGEENANF